MTKYALHIKLLSSFWRDQIGPETLIKALQAKKLIQPSTHGNFLVIANPSAIDQAVNELCLSYKPTWTSIFNKYFRPDRF